MDPLQMESIISTVTRQIEDLTYRIYKLEDSIAELHAYAEEQKEEEIDAQFRWSFRELYDYIAKQEVKVEKKAPKTEKVKRPEKAIIPQA